MAHTLPDRPASAQEFTFAGRVNVGYTTPGSPMWWRDTYTCSICGALVSDTGKGDVAGPVSNLALHARWHEGES